MLAENAESEADRNFAAFRKMLPALLGKSPGKFVVLHAGEMIDEFDTFRDAVKFGLAKFGHEKFSVQEVTTQSVTVGFHAYAFDQYPN